MVFSTDNSILSLPRLRPPITNPSTVKLPSIQWTPAPQSCLPGGISSLLAPSPPHNKQHKFHLGVNCTADDIDDAFFGKMISQFGVEEACKVTVEPFVIADKFVAEAKARHESVLF
jgi:hypothetical protein